VSTPQQPPRRRRIAGESKPGAPAARPPVKKAAKKLPTRPKPAAQPAQSARTTAPPPPPPPPAATPRRTEPRRPETETRPESEPSERRRRLDLSAVRGNGRLTALVVLAVAALAFGGWFGWQGWNDWRGDDVVESHEAAADAAATSAETIFTYRYDRLDEHLEDAQDTMTASFAKKFETISPALNDLAPQRKIQVRASTRDAAPLECGSECSTDEASVLVFLDQARLADGSKDPTVFGNRIQLDMVKQDGTWLVNEIKAL